MSDQDKLYVNTVTTSKMLRLDLAKDGKVTKVTELKQLNEDEAELAQAVRDDDEAEAKKLDDLTNEMANEVKVKFDSTGNVPQKNEIPLLDVRICCVVPHYHSPCV